jgi:hypothetical protein
MKKTLLILVVGILVVVVSILAYLSAYFTASQPENYGALRYKVYAWVCIISFLAGLLLCLWSLVRAISAPRPASDSGENRTG